MATTKPPYDPRSGGRVFCGMTGEELDPLTLEPLGSPEPIASPPPLAPIPEPEPEPIPPSVIEDPDLEESVQ